MSKDVELTCEYCNKKVQLVDYREARNQGWIIFGWKIEKNIPYVKCPKCKKII
jgi:DNA-directed RNA polymerase subunit RPC12/RpoP